MLPVSKTSLRWVRPILLTIGAILLLCSLLLGYTLNALRQTMLDSSSDLNQYLQQSADARLREIQKYSASLELHPTNTVLKRQQAPVTEISADVYRFSDQMTNYKLPNKLIQGIFVYYPKAQLIVGNLGCRAPAAYYALDNPLSTQGLDAWLLQIEQAGNGLVLLETNQQRQFCYIRTMMQGGEIVGYGVFQLDTAELLQATHKVTAESTVNAAFGVLLDDVIIAQSGDGALLEQMLTKNVRSSVLHRRNSDFTGLTYVNVYRERELLRPFSIALAVCVAGVVLCGLFGVMASVYIGRRNVAPLRSLMHRLGAQGEDGQDECQTIGAHIDAMLEARNLSDEKLQIQQGLIGSLFLNVVLAGEMRSEYAVFNAAKRCDVLFEQPYYLVGVISVPQQEPEPKQNSEILVWLEQKGYEATVSVYGSHHVVLLNLPEEIYQRSLVSEMQKLLQDVFPAQAVAAGLGQRFDSLVSIPASYHQAMDALRQAPQNVQGQVFCSSSVLELETERDMVSIAAMEDFTAALQAEQYSAALTALNGLLGQYENSMLSPTLRDIRFSALQSLLLDALRKARAEGTIAVEAFRSGEIFNCTTFPQLRRAGHSLLQQLQGAHATLPEGTVAQRAKAIIDRDFTDPMLGLYLLSDQLKISGPHLSTTFKATFGVGVVQYINQMRINQAKSLIDSTGMSIKEIAVAVGFSSDISFIRVFKKYESQTPNALRRQGQYGN